RTGDHGSSRRKGFDDRRRHIVEPRGIDEDVSVLVILADFLMRCDTGEVDAVEMQVRNQLADVGFERASAYQIELCFGIFFFYFGKCPDNDIHAVVSGEAASADQVRAQRSALPIAELREIDNVRHNRCWQSEFAEDIDEVAGGNDNLIDAREN